LTFDSYDKKLSAIPRKLVPKMHRAQHGLSYLL
jgi:hypothetical protein